MIRREDIEDVIPLTPFQQGVLFHDTAARPYTGQAEPGPSPFFQQLVVEITGPLDIAAFERAWQGLVDRHQILRCVYRTSGEKGPVQIALKSRAVRLTIADWQDLDSEAQNIALTDTIQAERARPFDLSAELLFRLVLARTAPDQATLIWSFHHIVIDGWCIDLLQRELGALYSEAVTGQSADLASPVPFSQYVAWLQQQATAHALDWWPGYLEDAQPVDPVPGFRRHRDKPTADHTIRVVTASAVDTDRLITLCQRHGITVATLVYTVWGLLLARLNDHDDVVIGAVASGRTAPIDGIERMLGPCLAALPYRVQITQGDSFAAVLRRAGQQAGHWLSSAVCALPDIQVRCARKGALFSHHVVFENFPIDARFTGDAQPLGAGVNLRQRDGVQATDDPVTIIVHPGKELHWQLRYDPTVVAPPMIETLAGALERLLTAIAANADAPVLDWSPVAPHQANTLWHQWGVGAAPAAALEAGATTLTELRQAVAERYRDRTALFAVDGTSALTHGELERRAFRLASGLTALGVSLGDRVVIATPPDADWLACILAIWQVGAAFVPMAPEGPLERRAAILRDCQPRLVIHDATAKDWYGIPTVSANALAHHSNRVAHAPPSVDPEATAYVVYTSGTTGVPKGVTVSHRAVLNYVGWLHRDAGIGPDDRTALLTAPEFDLGYTAVFGAALLGGGIALLDQDARRSVPTVLDTIGRHALTWLKVTPGYCRMLLSDPDIDRLTHSTHLSTLFVGGDKQDFDALAQLRSRLQTLKLWNHYGPTEATIGCVAGPIDDLVGADNQPQRIGRPIAGMRVAIVDRRGKPTVPGWPGELIVAGLGLSSGYLNATTPQAEAFIQHPVLGPSYRTGDRARWLPDGQIEILGRGDGQVKIRGHRVEIGEVEAALKAVDGIASAAALPIPSTDGELAVVAFITLEDPESEPASGGPPVAPTPETLRKALQARLPDPMLPSRFIPLSRLPLTPNGKLDRIELARVAATHNQADHSADTSVCLTPTETVVAPIWAKALSVERVTPASDFFALGGHSIKAVLVAAGLRKAFGKRIDIRSLFDHQTLRAFCAHLDRAGVTGKTAGPDAAGPPAPAETPLIPLKRSEDRTSPMLVLAGAVLGTATAYRELIDQIDRPLRAWGFQYPGFDREEPFAPSVSALGTAMAEAIGPDLPSGGPLILAGWSMGGAVAFEAARRLEQQGHSPAGVVLLDTVPPGWQPPRSEPTVDEPATLEALRASDGWRHILGLMAQNLDPAGWDRLGRLYRHNVRIARAWHPDRGIRSDIIALEAADNTYPIGMQSYEKFTDGTFRVQRVPGSHLTMFQPPHVQGLAAAFDQLLAR